MIGIASCKYFSVIINGNIIKIITSQATKICGINHILPGYVEPSYKRLVSAIRTSLKSSGTGDHSSSGRTHQSAYKYFFSSIDLYSLYYSS